MERMVQWVPCAVLVLPVYFTIKKLLECFKAHSTHPINWCSFFKPVALQLFHYPKFPNWSFSTLFLFSPKRNLFLFTFHTSVKSVHLFMVKHHHILFLTYTLWIIMRYNQGRWYICMLDKLRKEKVTNLVGRWIVGRQVSQCRRRELHI